MLLLFSIKWDDSFTERHHQARVSLQGARDLEQLLGQAVDHHQEGLALQPEGAEGQEGRGPLPGGRDPLPLQAEEAVLLHDKNSGLQRAAHGEREQRGGRGEWQQQQQRWWQWQLHRIVFRCRDGGGDGGLDGGLPCLCK